MMQAARQIWRTDLLRALQSRTDEQSAHPNFRTQWK